MIYYENEIALHVTSGNDGVLRLGVRRATQSKSSINVLAHISRNLNLATLAVVADSVTARKIFHIYYDPRYAWLHENFALCMQNPLFLRISYNLRSTTKGTFQLSLRSISSSDSLLCTIWHIMS